MDSPYIKIHQVLPKEVADAASLIDPKDTYRRNIYIKKLRSNEWSLQSIADVFSMTRERVRQISNEPSYPEDVVVEASYPAPLPPLRPVKEVKVVPEMSFEVTTRLKKLQPFAESVRANSPKYRAEAEEYTKTIFNEYSVNGVPLRKIADALGITTPAIRFRFARYGYVTSPSTENKCYKPILEKNRYVLHS